MNVAYDDEIFNFSGSIDEEQQQQALGCMCTNYMFKRFPQRLVGLKIFAFPERNTEAVIIY